MGLIARLRSSLTYPIAATLVLLTVVPVALVGWRLASYNREHLTTVEKRFLSLEARGLAVEVSEFLASHRIQLNSTVGGLEAGGAIDLTDFEVLLQEVASEPDRAFVHLQIINTMGQGTFVRNPELDPATARALNDAVTEAQQAALIGEAIEGLIPELPHESAAHVVFAFPLRSPDGEVWGSLTGVLDLGALEPRFQDSAVAGFIVTLFDGSGTVLVSSHPRLRGRNIASSPLVRDLLIHSIHLSSRYRHPVPSVAREALG